MTPPSAPWQSSSPTSNDPVRTGPRQAIIIGAGPAGLTAALELLRRTDVVPLILEASPHIGGISRTEIYKGNRIDIGGHRFFSRSQRVMDWWQEIMPIQGVPTRDDLAWGRDLTDLLVAGGPDPEQTDRVMLYRSRLSRILHHRRLLDYPLSVGLPLIQALGFRRLVLLVISYLRAYLFPIPEEKNLEDFFINRFGRRLYATFFRDYTEKVWGVSCQQIPAQWGAQRIKGLSMAGAMKNALRSLISEKQARNQALAETSLIARFLYPKLGPGQLWEEVARQIKARGGTILTEHQVVGLSNSEERINAVRVRAARTRDRKREREFSLNADFFFSTMAVRDLITAMEQVPAGIRQLASGLLYRDFLTVGLLLKKMTGDLIPTQLRQAKARFNGLLPDNWIYIQENDVRLGRLQIFNNWSPFMVQDPATIWVGLEYFCNENDDLWNMDDQALRRLGIAELASLGLIAPDDVLDGVVIRQPKAYPAYFGSHHRFAEIRNYTDSLENLFLIGRNGMHRYNNMDHSMLSAMAAVSAVAGGDHAKDAIWATNSDDDYHEGS
ncbi:MAG: NAD(P)/FAD-dependent oxidoreductase [Desulfobulbaceae bacterium]|nr:MAG: NAD(P)/FAD-dependent oxidoreductase [Desulfobulbaceae bacterium]